MGPRPPPLSLDGAGNHGDLQPPRYPDFHLDLPSPRPGEVPPALSPLDAFALHSRMLQKKFDEEVEKGRRVSRLSYDTVAKQLATRVNIPKNEGSGMDDIAESSESSRPNTRSGTVKSQSENRARPKSQYLVLGRVSRQDNEEARAGTPFFDAQEVQAPQATNDYFDGARTHSPELTDPQVNIEAPSLNVPSLNSSMDSLSSGQAIRALPDRSRMAHNGLLPGRSSYVSKAPISIQRVTRQDSGDDDTASLNGLTSNTLSPRKFSGSSGMSQPQSPFTPSFMHSAHRSPSMTSEYSLNGLQQSPRPAINFSRPDRAMSPEAIEVRSSIDSRRSFESRPSRDVVRHLPITTTKPTSSPSGPFHDPSMGLYKPFAHDSVASDSDADSSAARTYTYSKYTLPRGRNVDRESSGFRSSWIERQFQWDTDDQGQATRQTNDLVPHAQVSKQITPEARPASAVPNSSTHMTVPEPPAEIYELPGSTIMPARPALGPSYMTSDHIPVFTPPRRPESPASVRSSIFAELRRGRERAFSSSNRSRSVDARGPRPKTSHTPSASIATESSGHTVIQSHLDARTKQLEVTPEDHLEIGIQAHSIGQTNKSTYHLRLAAKAGLPTAMLLYALACRHGWGMRANQEEGVKWLQKAIEGSKLDEQDLDNTLSNASRRSGILDPVTEAAERKKRKAQFALAVYELGISYANGWGCTKDRVLALRCYEVAGKWGDCDALAEAGYCFAQGLGCKKDMHKAATLYRAAAASGMSMAGNSWIYKDKYNEPMSGTKGVDSANHKDKRARSRSIWSRPKKER